MIVLGISGLENSVPFKKSYWPRLEEREYRISQGHDSAAALIIDGSLGAAVAEERFNRKKHTGDFPTGAISYCLAKAGLPMSAIDAIVHSFDYSPFREAYQLDLVSAERYRSVFAKEALQDLVRKHIPGCPLDRVSQINHHLAHAASSYFTSGWDECLVIVVDAMGEVAGVTVYHAHDGMLDKIREFSASDSIGIFYSLITLHLGFDFNADEYKIMGLAPYGDAERFRGFFDRAVELHDDGSIRIPALRINRTRDEWENYLLTRKCFDKALVKRRSPAEEITDDHRDVAAGLQECLNRVMLHICGHFGGTTGLRRLALAGGVALNCTANGKLLRSGLFDEIYIQPAAGDDGAALGAALYGAAKDGGIRNVRLPVPFLGPSYGLATIEAALENYRDRVEVTRFATLAGTCAEAAKLIAAGRVVAWYRGRMEFGPRALGNRSILGDPSDPRMRDRVNTMVKKREAFRPFAPSVSLEQAHLWFDVPPLTQLPYMIATVNVREEHRAKLPAVTHVDGTARVQTVSTENNVEFHALLQAVGRVTGREMVLNTSFNVKGQPIVNTPEEALDTFLNSGIDFLFLENCLVSRHSVAGSPERQ